MARDYYNKEHGMDIFESISIVKFKEEYDKIKLSADKVPTASTVLPILASDGCSLRGEKDVVLYNVAIFWESVPQQEEAPKPEPKKKIIF